MKIYNKNFTDHSHFYSTQGKYFEHTYTAFPDSIDREKKSIRSVSLCDRISNFFKSFLRAIANLFSCCCKRKKDNDKEDVKKVFEDFFDHPNIKSYNRENNEFFNPSNPFQHRNSQSYDPYLFSETDFEEEPDSDFNQPKSYEPFNPNLFSESDAAFYDQAFNLYQELFKEAFSQEMPNPSAKQKDSQTRHVQRETSTGHFVGGNTYKDSELMDALERTKNERRIEEVLDDDDEISTTESTRSSTNQSEKPHIEEID